MDAIGEIAIARPRAAVARFMFDLRNAPLWATGLAECRPLSPGPLRVGMKIEQTSRLLGANATVIYEIISMDPERFIESRFTDPFEMWMLQELEDAPGGTLVRVRTKRVGGDPGFFRLFGPVLGWLTKYNLHRDLRRLKRAVEALPR